MLLKPLMIYLSDCLCLGLPVPGGLTGATHGAVTMEVTGGI